MSASAATSSSDWLTNTPVTSTLRRTALAIRTPSAGSHARLDSGHRISPTAHAPCPTASSASATDVMPQNLILGTRSATQCILGRGASAPVACGAPSAGLQLRRALAQRDGHRLGGLLADQLDLDL